MDTPVVDWRRLRSWAWLLGAFGALELYNLTQASLLGTALGWSLIGREWLESFWMALLVPTFWALAQRAHFQRVRGWRWLGANAALVAVFSAFHVLGFRALYLMLIGQLWNGSALGAPLHPVMTLSSAYHLTLLLGAFYGLDAHQRWRAREVLATRLSAQLAEARLKTLQMQLHPHFLFNTLQAITALIHSHPSQAETMLERLGALLREVLDHGETPFVPLRRELAFLEKYLALQQVRFGRRLAVCWEVASDLLDASVPTHILQPLVENALEHGTKGGAGAVTVGATRDEERLRLWVADRGPGPGKEAAWGQGLGNTEKRLHSVYGLHATLTLAPGAEGGALACLTFPLSPPQGEPA